MISLISSAYAQDTLPAAVVNNPEAGHQTGVFPPFDAQSFVPQIVWLVVIFGALYWLMSRVALPRVESILAARSTRIATDLDDARRMQDQAQAASAANDKTLADAKGRAQALAQDTHDKLHAKSEAKRHALEDELNTKLAAAEQQIGDMRTRALGNVDSIARGAAAAIVQHLTGKVPGSDAIATAVASTKTN